MLRKKTTIFCFALHLNLFVAFHKYQFQNATISFLNFDIPLPEKKNEKRVKFIIWANWKMNKMSTDLSELIKRVTVVNFAQIDNDTTISALGEVKRPCELQGTR